MGILYDTYRIFERMYKMKNWLIWICDLLFWTSCTFLVFGTLLRVNEGAVRIYIFLGIGIGTIIYLLTFREMYASLLKTIIAFVLAVYRALLKSIKILIIIPMLYLYGVLFTLVKWILKILMVVVKWLVTPFSYFGKKWGGWVIKQVHHSYLKMVKTLTNWIKRKKI